MRSVQTADVVVVYAPTVLATAAAGEGNAVGLDDDALVVTAVAKSLGRPELSVPVPAR